VKYISVQRGSSSGRADEKPYLGGDADDIYFEAPYFDGKTWTTKKFSAGGSADPMAKEITVLSGTSCEDATITFFPLICYYNLTRAAALLG